MDQNLIFGNQVKNAVLKADGRASAIARLMSNIGGPTSSKRKVLCGVVKSTLLYCAPIWHTAM